MNIIQKSQVELDLLNIEKAANNFSNSLNAAIITLNLAYNALWKLPDDRLVAALQRLYDTNTMMKLFDDHNFSAVNLNQIQDRTHESGLKAISVVGKEFTINPQGIVSLVYPPELEQTIAEDPIVE